MVDLQFSQNFQNQPSYSPFQVPPHQNEEPSDLEKSIEALIQAQNIFHQDIKRLEVQINQSVKTIDERTLSYKSLIIPDLSNPMI